MLIVIQTHSGDVDHAIALLRWMKKLNTYRAHDCLIVADADTPFCDVIDAQDVANSIFREARLTTNERGVKGWPDGCYSLFKTAQRFVSDYWPQPYLIVEPDAIPLRAGWLDKIEAEYKTCGKPFMGCIYDCAQPNLPKKLMSGIAVYPAESIAFLPTVDAPVHWDVFGAEVMVNNGAHTPLIKHFFGQVELPPIFVHAKNAHTPVNAFTLDWLPAEAVIFHRDKTHSLIRLLERKFFPHEFREKIAVCFNVHAGDISLALLHSQWLRTMAAGKKWDYRAVICHDPSAPVVSLNNFEQNLRHCFTEVETCVYARPPIPQYPASANFAFQSVALHMAKQKSPWLWFEADALALRPDWLDKLQNEYNRCGSGWMGPVVAHMNHLQGTAIYPADAATRMPRAMSCGADHAFDMAAHEDTMHDRHDASHLMHHCWSLLNRMSHPVGGGEIPANITADELRRWLPRESVFLHRVKDDSVLKCLMSGQYVH